MLNDLKQTKIKILVVFFLNESHKSKYCQNLLKLPTKRKERGKKVKTVGLEKEM